MDRRIFDPIHGFLHLNVLEQRLVDARPFQRLRYIRQLGLSYLIYPGATHTRFEHSLGSMQVVTQIFDAVTHASKISREVLALLPELADPEVLRYWRQILRLAALCHDMGHLPFSHAVEPLLEGGHESMTVRLLQLPELQSIWQDIDTPKGREAVQDITKLSVGPRHLAKSAPHLSYTLWEKVLAEMLTGDSFGADRIDYLLRDARYTGVAYGVIDHYQILETLRLLKWSAEVAIGVQLNGLPAVESLLLARYFMHSRIYQHPAIRLYGFHLRRFLQEQQKFTFPAQESEAYLTYTDNELLVALRQAVQAPTAAGYRHACALLIPGQKYATLLARDLDETQSKQVVGLSVELQERFGNDVGMEALLREKGETSRRSFPCEEGEQVINAAACSEFLEHIPPMPRVFLLFSPPELLEEVREWLLSKIIGIRLAP